MHRLLRTIQALLFGLLASTSTVVGCRMGSVCNPPGASSGQIVAAENSEAYQLETKSRDGGETPHMGCRAEAVLPTTFQVLHERTPMFDRPQDSVRMPVDESNRYPQKGSVAVDPRLHAGTNLVSTEQGEYRVLGVGRGIDRDDCGKTALKACNDAIDAYALQARMVRPPNIVCQLSMNQEYCQQ